MGTEPGPLPSPNVYLSLGSNLGDRRSALQDAVNTLQDIVDVRILSSLYETDPVGPVDQPTYYNLALAARTDLHPLDLLTSIKEIERAQGRTPTYRWGPRVIDIDILLHNGYEMSTPSLTVPHPEMHRRAFVLIPLAQIAPDLVLPSVGKTIDALSRQVEGGASVRHVGGPQLVLERARR